MIPELLEKLDNGELSFNPAVELSYLTIEEQKEFIDAMEYTQAVPSISQAQRMKKLSREKKLTGTIMREIMGEIKKGEITRVMFNYEQLYRYFPKSYTPAEMKEEILSIKSIGNSTTTPRDLENDQDVQIILMALAESVAARLRKHGFKCNVVSISIRDNGLFHFTRQRKLQEPTDITDEIMSAAYRLFRENYHWPRPIRSLGIRADDLVMGQVPVQLDLFMNEQRREKQEKLDRAVDDIRRRFGYHSVQRAFMYQDKILSSLDAQGSHTVHPVGYFNGR